MLGVNHSERCLFFEQMATEVSSRRATGSQNCPAEHGRVGPDGYQVRAMQPCKGRAPATRAASWDHWLDRVLCCRGIQSTAHTDRRLIGTGCRHALVGGPIPRNALRFAPCQADVGCIGDAVGLVGPKLFGGTCGL